MCSPNQPDNKTETATIDTPKSAYDKLIGAIFDKPWKETEEAYNNLIPEIIESLLPNETKTNYNVLLFLDQSNPIGEDHADRIYSAIGQFEEKAKDVFLILGSRGGQIEPGQIQGSV